MRLHLTSGYLVAALLFGLSSNPVIAAENSEENTPAKPPSSWNADIEAGAVTTSGNTSSSSLNFAVNAKYTADNWLAATRFTALTSRENKKTSKEKYTGRLNFNRNISENLYLGWIAQQEKDRFSGYYYQSSTAIHLGYKAINSAKHQVNLEVGPGYRREKEKVSDDVTTENLIRLAADYAWQISKDIELVQEYSVEASSAKSIQHYELGFKTQINSSLAAKISYKFKRDSNVPPTSSKRDTQTSLNLVYKLK